MTSKSPNIGRELQALVRRIPAAACVPPDAEAITGPLLYGVRAKSLLRELVDRYVPKIEGSAPAKAKLLALTGLDEAGLTSARQHLRAAGLIDWRGRTGPDGKPQTTLYTFNRAALEKAAGQKEIK